MESKEAIIVFNMTWKDIGLFVGLLCTFIGVIVNLVIVIVNGRLNRRNLETTKYIDTITAERIRWLEKLRQDISNFSGLTNFWARTIGRADTDEAKQILKEIDTLRFLIKLRLNPNGRYDQEIMKLLDEIPNRACNFTNLIPLNDALGELTVVSQKLLKEEWNRVKEESKKGAEVIIKNPIS